MAVSWYKQALTQGDNKTYEGAYLALAFVIALAGFSIISMIALAFFEVIMNKNEFNPAGLGGGISAVLGGLAAFLGGIGAYILLDRKQPNGMPAQSTTTIDTREVKTVVAAAPTPSAPAAPVSDVEMLAAGRGVEKLAPRIGPDDVGKNVALISTKRKPKKGKR